jgi:hypothetical protein
LPAARADDIVMIVFYTVFLSIEGGGSKVSWLSFLNIPLSIVSGIGVGIGIGFLFAIFPEGSHA